DIYSLGCTLYHLLTGQPPFPARSLTQKLLYHQQSPPPSVCDVRPELPRELAEVIQKMMAKAPDDRFQTPAGLVVKLARFCGGGERVRLERLRPVELPPDVLTPPLPAEGVKALGLPTSAPAPAAQPAPEKSAAQERRKAPRRAGNPVPVQITT